MQNKTQLYSYRLDRDDDEVGVVGVVGWWGSGGSEVYQTEAKHLSNCPQVRQIQILHGDTVALKVIDLCHQEDRGSSTKWSTLCQSAAVVVSFCLEDLDAHQAEEGRAAATNRKFPLNWTALV